MRTDSNGCVKLAAREAEILRLLCTEAPTNKEIANRLGITEVTVRDHLGNMRLTLNIWSRGVLLIWGLQHPAALLGEWVDPARHKPGCECGSVLCTLALAKAA